MFCRKAKFGLAKVLLHLCMRLLKHYLYVYICLGTSYIDNVKEQLLDAEFKFQELLDDKERVIRTFVYLYYTMYYILCFNEEKY